MADPRLDTLVSHASAAERDARTFALVVELYRNGDVTGQIALARFSDLELQCSMMRTVIDDIINNPV